MSLLIRYRPWNILLHGLTPGPHEYGADELKHFVKPLVDDLLHFVKPLVDDLLHLYKVGVVIPMSQTWVY
jgi:hypothetical protein